MLGMADTGSAFQGRSHAQHFGCAEGPDMAGVQEDLGTLSWAAVGRSPQPGRMSRCAQGSSPFSRPGGAAGGRAGEQRSPPGGALDPSLSTRESPAESRFCSRTPATQALISHVTCPTAQTRKNPGREVTPWRESLDQDYL